MNYINKYLIGFFICLIIGLSACTDNFDKINTDKTGFTKEQQAYDYNSYGIPASVVQQGIYFNYNFGGGTDWTFQIMQNLSVDMFSGYFHDFNPFNGGLTNTVYKLQDGWNETNWVYTYGYILPEANRFLKLAQKNDQKPMIAVAKILKVLTMHRVSDIYGPIVYTTFGNSKVVTSADSQQEAYNAFFNDLDSAATLLKNYIKTGGPNTFEKFDILMPTGKKTYEYWLKFANSLRLRLAMRISFVDTQKAKDEIAKSLAADSGGVLENATDVVGTSTENGYINPLGTIGRVWGEVHLNANMESIMTGYDDPRLVKYFDPLPSSALDTLRKNVTNSPFRGIRQGTGFAHKKYLICSQSTITQKTNAILMTPAEVWLLRAEAALRNLSANGDNAKTCYEKGIQASFEQWGISSSKAIDYLNSNSLPAKFVDIFDKDYDSDAVSTITPKWNDADSESQKLERIITQKWIACYPEGCEAWAEQRRTGYPKLFPILRNESNGTIDSKILIRRLPFPVSLVNGNPGLLETLRTKLGGPDNGGTRLWWDIAVK